MLRSRLFSLNGGCLDNSYRLRKQVEDPTSSHTDYRLLCPGGHVLLVAEVINVVRKYAHG